MKAMLWVQENLEMHRIFARFDTSGMCYTRMCNMQICYFYIVLYILYTFTPLYLNYIFNIEKRGRAKNHSKNNSY